MEIIRKEFTFPSKTGLADIFVRGWLPADGAHALFQICHGMAEHGERYEEFAASLCEKGFAVFVNDHIGHGKSVTSDEKLGYFGENGGWDAFVEDERTLTEILKKDYPNLPLIFFGHSMGSFIAREYIARYGTDTAIKGAIICGTSGKNPASALAIGIAGAIAKFKGSEYKSKFIDGLAFGSYNKKIASPRTTFDWLTNDNAIVDKYINDKYCGFIFTAAGFKDLFTILTKVSGKDWFGRVTNNLPVLFISGADDPVGQYGSGVMQVYNDLKFSGQKDITVKIYPDMRHEILNEIKRKDVYEDVAIWCISKIN